ncbi:FG-GAP repeat domain-containing protein, partial [Emticicia sp. 17c]|uniref:FG-GAP repeat domain-containing protein n=1 Tax=Emticicia sp. 17c TaxID=3127704 RepID=UPI00301CC245
TSSSLQDRFYVNDGKGHFSLEASALPTFLKSGSCVKASDYDHDGDLDLFIGGRVEPGAYPKPVSSYILRNDSSGGVVRFTDVTSEVAGILKNIGLVCDGVWSDYDNDGWDDLIIVGEWMPITVLHNNSGKLEPLSQNGGLSGKVGWWTSISSGDFDNDGDMDYIVGNQGLNTLMRASEQEPVSIYSKDFNNDGFYDAIPTVYFPDASGKRQEYPYNTRDDLAKQFIQTRQRFQNYAKFSEASIKEILKPEEMKDALVLRSSWMQSSYVENKGGGIFEVRVLPIEAQFAPVYGLLIDDYDGDGYLDVLVNGNDYGTEVSVGRHDGLNGLLLRGNGKGGFVSVLPEWSGYCVRGDGKALVRLSGSRGDELILASQNRGDLRFFRYNGGSSSLVLGSGDRVGLLHLSGGRVRRVEVGYVSSFLSSSSRRLYIPKGVEQVEIIDNKGNKRQIKR